MLIYWIQASNFVSLNNQKNIYNTKILGSVGMLVSNLSLFTLLALRWYESGHFPLSNLYESLMFLSWSLTLIHLFIEIVFGLFPIKFLNFFESGVFFRAKTYDVRFSKQSYGKEKRKLLINKLIGSITAPCALFTNAFATFSLPKEMQESSPLVPALQSNWLMMHVTVMILSYSALILGSLLSIGFLVITSGGLQIQKVDINTKKTLFADSFNSNNQKNMDLNFLNKDYGEPVGSLRDLPTEKFNKTGIITDNKVFNSELNKELTFGLNITTPLNQTINNLNTDAGIEICLALTNQTKNSQKQNNRLNLAKILDNLSYRILGLGFPLLTIGILSGAVWANEAWGSYWSWDPKETWALLTWLVFAIYLHTRLTKGWEGKKPALIASLGFVTVWVCFLGVNLIGEGLHSYGWLS